MANLKTKNVPDNLDQKIKQIRELRRQSNLHFLTDEEILKIKSEGRS